MKNKNVKTLKNELKQLAEEIKVAKNERKAVRFTGKRTIKSKSPYYSDAQEAAFVAIERKRQYRHKHVAYCMLHGKQLEQIEPKHRDDTESLDMRLIKAIMKEYDWSPEEKEAYIERHKTKLEVA